MCVFSSLPPAPPVATTLVNPSCTPPKKAHTRQPKRRLTKNVGPLFRQADQVACDLIITSLGGVLDFGQHRLLLLLPFGIKETDAHVLCFL